MRIAIAGSHGVGKTTFAKALAERLKFNYIPDIVREEAVKKGFLINQNTPPEVQLWLVNRQRELENTTSESWVADKSLKEFGTKYVVLSGSVEERVNQALEYLK